MEEDDGAMVFPPGFRFHPTDEEIITHYLSPKVLNHGFSARAMGEVNLNKCEPWDLPSKAKMGEKEWYFFCQRDRKYPTGMRTNRATEKGYWKATGKDKEIFRGRGTLVGMKKTLVFYLGRAPKGEKTNWVMHEFRLEGKFTLPKSAKDEWVVCRVFHKNTGVKRAINSFTDELLESPTLPPLMDPPFFFSGGGESFDLKTMTESSPFSSMINGVEDSLIENPTYFRQVQPQMNPYLAMPAAFETGYQLPQPPPPAATVAATAIRRYCKAEQFSTQSMLSQDTGVSTEISSSVVSRQDMGSCASNEEFDVPHVTAVAGGEAPMDLADMWRF